MSLKNVDDMIQIENAQKMNSDYTPPPAPAVEPPVETPDPDVDYKEQEAANEDSNSPSNEPEAPSKQQTAAQPEHEIDEYGNPVAPAKLYTQQEVQEMIRDRLSRGNYSQQQPTQQQVQDAASGFKPDPDSPDSWEKQLEDFVDSRIDRKAKREREESWKAQEMKVQKEFEAKFDSGMAKYKDFHSVVAGKPISDAMMLATRNLEDPAAFIYAASKNHAKELERIASLPDPYQQASEIGRLETKMRKVRTAANTAKPLTRQSSDLAGKSKTRNSIDDLIKRDAESRLGRGAGRRR
jgi:hypothetical protein